MGLLSVLELVLFQLGLKESGLVFVLLFTEWDVWLILGAFEAQTERLV